MYIHSFLHLHKHTCLALQPSQSVLYHVSKSVFVCHCTYISTQTTCDHTNTYQTELCCHHKKSFVAVAQAGWLFTKGQSWLQITAGRPRPVMDLNACSVYPHTCTPADSRHSSTAESTQPFCSTSKISPSLSPPSLLLSSPCMRNRWGGAIKWICCYFPRLLAEDVKPQPVRKPKMTAVLDGGKHTHHSLCHAHDQLSCFCVMYQIAWACDEWAQISKGKKGFRFALGRCYAHVTAYNLITVNGKHDIHIFWNKYFVDLIALYFNRLHLSDYTSGIGLLTQNIFNPISYTTDYHILPVCGMSK